MKLDIDKEFLSILQEIEKSSKSPAEWAEVESDDMFQSENYVGGFDADEMAFCFSYYNPEQQEYWFQVEIDEIQSMLEGKATSVKMTVADK